MSCSMFCFCPQSSAYNVLRDHIAFQKIAVVMWYFSIFVTIIITAIAHLFFLVIFWGVSRKITISHFSFRFIEWTVSRKSFIGNLFFINVIGVTKLGIRNYGFSANFLRLSKSKITFIISDKQKSGIWMTILVMSMKSTMHKIHTWTSYFI